MSFDIYDIHRSDILNTAKYNLHITLSKNGKDFKKALKCAHPNILAPTVLSVGL